MRSVKSPCCVQEIIGTWGRELKSRSNLILTCLWPCNLTSVPGSCLLSHFTPSSLSLFLVLNPRSSGGRGVLTCLFKAYLSTDPNKSPALLHKLLLEPPILRAPPRGSCSAWYPVPAFLITVLAWVRTYVFISLYEGSVYYTTRQNKSDSVVELGVGW